MTINYEDDIVDPTDEQLTCIAALARMQMVQQVVVGELVLKLKEAQKVLQKIQEIDLPEAMGAAGTEEFVTSSGLAIKISETLYASITKKNKPAAVKWLMDNGQSALVKENIIILFDKGDHKKAAKLFAALVKKKYPVISDESVNTGSVKSMIKELLEQGKKVPLELFGAYFHRRAEVTLK